MGRIRIATLEDYEVYYKIKCGYSDIYWNGFEKAPDKEGLKKSFESRLENTPNILGSKVLFMIENDEGIPCGYIMFTYNETDVELGFSILEKYQGHGYGTMAVAEALKLLRGRLVFARIRPDNIPSQRCFEKNGFQFSYQETETRFYPLDGSYHCYNRFEYDNK